MISKIINIFKQISAAGRDFSDEGFVFRERLPEPTKLFLVPRMWIGNGGSNMGWRSGTKKCIIRCYDEGFSFWHGSIDEDKEWFACYRDIQGFKKPLKISFASSIITLSNGGGTIDCMLGEAADYIENLLSVK